MNRPPLLPETRAQIQAVCEEIASGQLSNEEVRLELADHIEDKVLAYLDGTESLSEQDAVVLARAHFGKSAMVKSMLERVHPFRMTAERTRRLMTVATTQIAMDCAVFTVAVDVFDFLGPSFPFLAQGLSVALLVLALRYTQRWEASGRMAWSQSLSPKAFAWFMFSALLLGSLTPNFFLVPTISGPKTFILLAVQTCVLPVLTCVIWIWWCDRPPRTGISMLLVSLAWLLFEWSRGLFRVLIFNLFGLYVNDFRAFDGTISTMGWRVFSNVYLVTAALVACGVYAILKNRRESARK